MASITPASRAALGLVGESTAVEEQLFVGAENKLSPAVAAVENAVLKLHT
jgi:hypothetical protein